MLYVDYMLATYAYSRRKILSWT